MKYRLVHYPPISQMLDHDSLQQRRGDAGIPDALGVDDDDRAASTDTQAGRLTALHAIGPEQQLFALQKRGEQIVELAPSAVRRAEATHAHQDVP